MTKKSFKYLLLAGLVVGVTAGPAWAGSPLSYASSAVDTARGVSNFARTFMKLTTGTGLWPVIDITSIPAHAVVGIEQKLIRKRTRVEDDLKDDIRRRLSLDKKKVLTTESSSDSGSDAGESGGTEGSGEDNDPKRVDGKLSKIQLNTCGATDNVEGGLVGEGTDKEVTKDGKETTTKIAEKEREGYTSAAGSLSEQEKYALKRQYQEQEEAIRVLALAVALRSSIDEKLKPMMDAAEGHYNKTFTKEDLDQKNKKENVKSKKYEEADQNQAWRDYTYFSVIYDELLSLEQQVVGLRLQARGGLSEQSTEPVVEIDYSDNN